MPANSLPLSSIINVSVSIAPAAVPGPSFNQALIVGATSVIPTVGTNSRMRLYSSLNAMASDGFQTSDPEYLAAELYFGQTPSPTYLWVGRQDLTAIAAFAVGAAAGTGYAPGDIVTVVQSGATGGQLKVATVGTGGAVTGLDLIPGSQGSGYSVATNLATTGGSGTGLEINVTAIGETPVAAMQACRLASPLWYCCMFVGTAADADHQAIAAWAEGASPATVYFLTTGSTAVLNGTAGNLLANLQDAKYRRTFPVYSTTQGGAFPNNAYASAAAMGLAMGMNNGAAGSYFDLMFKAIAGVAPEPLTETQVQLIAGTVDRQSQGLNGNLVVNYQNGAYTWLQMATTSSGVFFDEVLNLDMLVSDMQISGVTQLVGMRALPITDAGVALMKNVFGAACERAKTRGFIAPAGTWTGTTIGTSRSAIATGDPLPNGYALYADPVSKMSSAQRAARVLPPITVVLVEAQSGHSVAVLLDVQR